MALINSNNVINLQKYKKENSWLKRLLILNIAFTTINLLTWLLQGLKHGGF